jgi:hypothetical protein
MRLDNGLDGDPLFRKVAMPWYDGPIACWLLVAAMLIVIIFSWVGIQVAGSHPFYDTYLWVPVTLLLLAALVAVSVLLRLSHRYYARYIENRDL